MSVMIRDLEKPADCLVCIFSVDGCCIINRELEPDDELTHSCQLIEVPTPHGDLIDRDALIKDGWLNLHKEVIRMGGYAIHELPLKNPSIPVIIPAEGGE